MPVSSAISRNCTEPLKEAIARALRHSRAEGQRTYDRRTSYEKKKPALDYARQHAVSSLNESSSSTALPSVGQFVGLVEESSTAKQPKILIGRVQFLVDTDVYLLWFKEVQSKKNCYELFLDGKPWVEKPASLIPISMKETKEKGIFRLLTKQREIYNQVFKER